VRPVGVALERDVAGRVAAEQRHLAAPLVQPRQRRGDEDAVVVLAVAGRAGEQSVLFSLAVDVGLIDARAVAPVVC
jgi:hypothetical protein